MYYSSYDQTSTTNSNDAIIDSTATCIVVYGYAQSHDVGDVQKLLEAAWEEKEEPEECLPPLEYLPIENSPSSPNQRTKLVFDWPGPLGSTVPG